jgi:hypothetical protein
MQRATPDPAALRRVAAARARRVQQGLLTRFGKRRATTVSCWLYRLAPSRPETIRFHVRTLLAPPVADSDLAEAVELIDRLVATDGGARPNWQLYTVLLDAQVAAGIGRDDVFARLRTLAELTSFDQAAQPARRALRRLEMDGRPTDATSIALDLAASVDARFAQLAHETALRGGDVSAAIEAAAIADHQPWMTAELRTRLSVERSMAADDVAAALEQLAQLGPVSSDWYSRQFVRALAEIGRSDEVLDYLRTADHGLDATTAALSEADALWWLGRSEESRALLTGLAGDGVPDRRVLARLRDHELTSGNDGGSPLADRLREQERQVPHTPDALGRLVPLYWELGLLDDVDRLAAAIEDATPDENALDPRTRLVIARHRYVARRFDAAVTLIDGLRGTAAQSDAEKLRALILLEQGDFPGALANRRSYPRPLEWMDNVTYFALLQQRRYGDAFALYPTRQDRHRLAAVLGDRAEDGSRLDPVGSRLVVAQAGPGDEINLAGTYHALRELSSELLATCDPRLETLLRRSFPDVEFLPVERLEARRPGGLAPGTHARSGDVLFPVLTDEARGKGLGFDRVVLAKSLHHLTVSSEQPAPYAAYLEPVPELVDAFTRRWPTIGRTVGIVWRSELLDPMRRVHYLTVPELSGLFGPDDVVVCLQYDATALEWSQLEQVGAGSVVIVDDVDLRNDFESTAALVASLDAVVGVPTTMTELSGAVGARTILLEPTHLGTWRATDAAATDFWHRSMRVAVVDPPWDRHALVQRARELLDEGARHVKPASGPRATPRSRGGGSS